MIEGSTLIEARCDCGEMATAGSSRVECGACFRKRILSISVDKASFDTSELHNYYDREAITEMFGDDAKDRYMEETKGCGAAYRGPDGGLWREDRTDGWVRTNDEFYTGKDIEAIPETEAP